MSQLMIKIVPENIGKIADLLAQCAGKHKAYVHDAYDVGRAAEVAEERLEAAHMPKAVRAGATYRVKKGGLGRSYKYTAEGTEFVITRRTAGWYLTSLKIESIWPGAPAVSEMRVSKEQLDAAVSGFIRETGFKLKATTTTA